VLKPHNLLEQLRLMADSPAGQGRPSIAVHFDQTYKAAPLVARMCQAVQTNININGVTVAEYTD